MGIFDLFFGGKDKHSGWTPRQKGVITGVSYEDLVSDLGKPITSSGGGIYWRMPMSSIDDWHSEDEYFQLSSRPNPGGRGIDRAAETWDVVATSDSTIRDLANELGALVAETSPV